MLRDSVLIEGVFRAGALVDPRGLADVVGPAGAGVPLSHHAVAAPLQPVGDLPDLLLVFVDGVEVGEPAVGSLAAVDLDPAHLVDLDFARPGPALRGDVAHLILLLMDPDGSALGP